MKRILLHLAISVLAFGLGVSVSALWRSFVSANQPRRFVDIAVAPPSPVLSREEVGIACGPRGSAYSHYYYLSNGGEITRTCQSFSSAAEAIKRLQGRHGRGSYTVEWSVNINSEGQPVGETVLVVEDSKVVRLSTSLGRLCETRASSMDDMRWFESREFH